jgi:hypothetical protein
MNIVALILVLDASILASMQAPDLPDDFRTSSGTTAAVEPAGSQPAPLPVVPAAVPSIKFESVAQATSGLKATTSKVTERWLVSEDWCANCPAAKARFKRDGGKQSNIITIAQANALHKKAISAVPAEYTTEAEVIYLQPPTYRQSKRMEVALNKDHTPSKSEILNHLRNGGPHQGKHWQAWHLESWEKEQLYALHDDDHAESVPTFDSEPIVTATISNAQLSADTIAAALSAHVMRTQPVPQASTGLLDITIDTPDSARGWIADLLTKQSVEFPSAGVSAQWGGDRQISIAPGSLRIQPGATVSVKKFGVQVTTTLTGIAFDERLSWVKLELKGVPDLTVRFE